MQQSWLQLPYPEPQTELRAVPLAPGRRERPQTAARLLPALSHSPLAVFGLTPLPAPCSVPGRPGQSWLSRPDPPDSTCRWAGAWGAAEQQRVGAGPGFLERGCGAGPGGSCSFSPVARPAGKGLRVLEVRPRGGGSLAPSRPQPHGDTAGGGPFVGGQGVRGPPCQQISSSPAAHWQRFHRGGQGKGDRASRTHMLWSGSPDPVAGSPFQASRHLQQPPRRGFS